ncbi:uncharacterized protein YALI1_E23629g [Yarrowia lipolytica]|uniref:Uncharacterized protein n=1 Tax=Yarrowia lipolytica TaxID=4952 RepID=A0A1D8NJ63_YARLL|nr:hypothetical protein YALI1_E23629g [Yarrowia lipolytica]
MSPHDTFQVNPRHSPRRHHNCRAIHPAIVFVFVISTSSWVSPCHLICSSVACRYLLKKHKTRVCSQVTLPESHPPLSRPPHNIRLIISIPTLCKNMECTERCYVEANTEIVSHTVKSLGHDLLAELSQSQRARVGRLRNLKITCHFSTLSNRIRVGSQVRSNKLS